nr:methyl-accepting chemotaxis protein [Lysinibacillus timonensis]
MTTVQENLHETVKLTIAFAPTIKKLFQHDIAITISDREKIVEHIHSKDFTFNIPIGKIIEPNEPMAKVIRTGEREIINIPEEIFGIAIKAIFAPIVDHNRKVVGTIAIASNLNNHHQLKQVAEQFATSSEEISDSTVELSSTSQDFHSNMKYLAEAQAEMTKQVDNSTRILDMINNVAKNTRILGFNAGIEAARSGEYGRGFSVVAKEITKLADQSAQSVNEIKELMDSLKERVQQVESIINKSVDISQSQSVAIEEISKTIHHLTEVADDIEELAKRI